MGPGIRLDVNDLRVSLEDIFVQQWIVDHISERMT